MSGYRWRDGVGPVDERPTRMDLAWHDLEPNAFGTNEFVDFCRKLGTEPYLAVNVGDGDMREARDWLEYCNGTQDTALVKLRRQHGYDEPHRIKYWGVGNEVDGPWQIGFKTPEEVRARLHRVRQGHEVDRPEHRALRVRHLGLGAVGDRADPALDGARGQADRLHGHPLVRRQQPQRGYRDDDFASYMAISERLEDMLTPPRASSGP